MRTSPRVTAPQIIRPTQWVSIFGFGLGAWRFLLALIVALSHLWSGMLPGPAAYAVWGFFVLSGFVMSVGLQDRYSFQAGGLLVYARNRALRIFPPFWMACLLGVLTLLWLDQLGIDPHPLNPGFGLPQSGAEWGFHLTLLPIFPRWTSPVPVANALSVEVGWYVLMPLLALHRLAAGLALLLGIAVTTSYGLEVASFSDRYALFWPAAPAFALGALLAHFRTALSRFARADFSVALWMLHGGLWVLDSSWPWTYGLYVSMLLSAWVVLSLYTLDTSHRDSVAGNLSYPLYLVHSSCGALLLPWFGTGRPLAFALLAMSLSLVIAWMLWRWVERPVQRWRQ